MHTYIHIYKYTYIYTYRLIPPKLVRDWKLLFIKGIPLYEDSLMKSTSDISSLQLYDGNDILDNEDLKEYLVSI